MINMCVIRVGESKIIAQDIICSEKVFYLHSITQDMHYFNAK